MGQWEGMATYYQVCYMTLIVVHSTVHLVDLNHILVLKTTKPEISWPLINNNHRESPVVVKESTIEKWLLLMTTVVGTMIASTVK